MNFKTNIMNPNELVNLHHCIYFTEENEKFQNSIKSTSLIDFFTKYHNPILVSAAYVPYLDSNGNTQLQLYVCVNNEWIAATDYNRVKSLSNENLLEAVFYLLQEVSQQRNEIEELKKLTNKHCQF